jgi:hypothetical protein
VRLVIAESFERICRQNADNVGLYTSTDFGLIDRIVRGDGIELAQLLAGRAATWWRSKQWAPNCCNRPAAPAPTAGRAPRPTPVRSA